MKQVGKIFGDVIDSSFTFASKEYYKKTFVKIQDEESGGKLIGEIIKKKVVNKFLATPQVVKYLSGSMDLARDTLFVYEVSVVGVIGDGKAGTDSGNISLGDIPPLPGKDVYEAEKEEIAAVYGIHKTDCEVGYLRNAPDCTVYLDLNRVFSPHMTIIGKTGSGKSYFATGLLRQITEQKFYVFSPGDEYNHVAKEMSADLFEEVVLPLNVENISYFLSLNMSEESIYQKINFAGDKEYTVKEILAEIVSYYQKTPKEESGQMRLDLGGTVEKEVKLPQYALSLMQKFRNLKNLKFTSRPSEKIRLNKSTVFDMSMYTQVEQECIINYFLYRLYQGCKRSKNTDVEKRFIFIEEAHNYVPSVKSTLCKDILIRLAREGRKYGLCLCFITQRPRNFDQTSFSQSSNKVVFSIPHPDDVKYVLDDAVYYSPQMTAVIQGQKQGQCVFIGDAFQKELEMQIRF